MARLTVIKISNFACYVYKKMQILIKIPKGIFFKKNQVSVTIKFL